MKPKTTSIILILLMIIGFFLRTYYLKQGNILFGYDQARDAYTASQIMKGDLKILGPPVSLGGFYHGVFYFYFISLPYFLSQGDPKLPVIFISFLNISALPLVYLIGKKLFNQKVAVLSIIFYTISFDIIQYSNWLSNPSLAVPFSVLFFYGLVLYLFSNKKTAGAFLTALGYGLCFQSQFFLGYLIIPIVFSLYFFKVKPRKKEIVIFITTFLLTISTMLLSYFKFGFTFIDGLKNMFSGKDQFSIETYDFFDTAKLVLTRIVENFSRVIFPSNSFFTFIFLSSCFYFYTKKYKRKNKETNYLTLFWIFIFSQILILPFGGTSTAHINVGLQLPAIIISSVFLIKIFNTQKILSSLIIVVFILSSLFTDIKFNSQGSLLLAIQRELTYKNEIEAIVYTYKDSSGQPFSINTITSPYWVNTLWSYLYQQYGQKTYNYIPTFHGRDQTGQLSYLPSDVSSNTKYFYLIIEPNNGIPQYLIDDTIAYEDSFSNIIETKNFNGILVQKRQLTKPLSEITFVK